MSARAPGLAERLDQGRVYEEIVAGWLRRSGWYVSALADLAPYVERAPMIRNATEAHILPDLDCMLGGRRFYGDVKEREAPCPNPYTGVLEHGIPLPHWRAYEHVSRHAAAHVWIYLVEIASGIVLIESIEALARTVRILPPRPMPLPILNARDEMRATGEAFFPRDAFGWWIELDAIRYDTPRRLHLGPPPPLPSHNH